MNDKWSVDEDIMLRWQLVVKLVNAKGACDSFDMGNRWERLGFLMRSNKR